MRHPFAPTPVKRQTASDKRRSTRLDAVVPIIISGRDAAGEPFRDETQTLTVNLHGARIQTHRELLVGMLVTIECVPTGAIAKAICVRALESEPDSDVRHMAVRLVHPGNVWGIPNPPADWAVNERARKPEQAPVHAAEVENVSPAESEILIETEDLEVQANQIVDAAALRLRGLVEEILGVAFDEFQQRVDASLAAAEARLNERSSESVLQLESTLKKVHKELEEALDLRTAQAVAATEQTLRAEMPNILSSIFASNLKAPPPSPIQLKSED